MSDMAQKSLLDLKGYEYLDSALKQIKILENQLYIAQQRSNNYAKRLAQEGFDDVMYFATEFQPGLIDEERIEFESKFHQENPP